MERIIVGDIVRLKKDSHLFNNYYFSKRKEKRFIIISMSSYYRMTEPKSEDEPLEKVSVISLDEAIKNKFYRLQYALPKYDLNNFYKTNQIRLLLEKKESSLMNKIMSR
jgi:hypothetical protein